MGPRRPARPAPQPALDRPAFLAPLAAQERQGVALWLLTLALTDLGYDLRTVTLTTVPRTMLSTIETLLARASEHLPLRILVEPVDIAVPSVAALVVVTTLPRERLLVPLAGNALVVPLTPSDWTILEQTLIAHRTCVAWAHHHPSTRTRAEHPPPAPPTQRARLTAPPGRPSYRRRSAGR